MSKIDEYIIFPTGEGAFCGADVKCSSFIDVYAKRMLFIKSSKGHLSKEEGMSLLYRTYSFYESIQVGENWLKLISNEYLSWKEQKSIAESTPLNIYEQYGIMFQAEKMGYDYSEYHNRIFPKNIQKEKLPYAVYLDENDTLQKVGMSEYSNGLLKSGMLEQGNTIFVQVMSKNDTWHCFFSAARGVRGQESGKKKHIHYVSSKQGMLIDTLVESILSCKYKGDKAHINNYSEDIPDYLK